MGHPRIPNDKVAGLQPAADRVGVRGVVGAELEVVITIIRFQRFSVVGREAREDGAVRTIDEDQPSRTLGNRRRQVHQALEHLSCIASQRILVDVEPARARDLPGPPGAAAVERRRQGSVGVQTPRLAVGRGDAGSSANKPQER